MAQIGPLLNSAPCYAAPRGWSLTSPAIGEYVVLASGDSYNLLNNVRYDRNWGRSAWSVPAVQQYRPYDIVDEAHAIHIGPMIRCPFPYGYMPYWNEVPIKPYEENTI